MIRDTESTVQWMNRIKRNDAKLDGRDIEALAIQGQPIPETRPILEFIWNTRSSDLDTEKLSVQLLTEINNGIEDWLNLESIQALKFRYVLEQHEGGQYDDYEFTSFFDAMKFYVHEIGGIIIRIIRIDKYDERVPLTNWMRPDTMPETTANADV